MPIIYLHFPGVWTKMRFIITKKITTWAHAGTESTNN